MNVSIINKSWEDVNILSSTPTEILVNICSKFSSNISFDINADPKEDLLVIFEPIACVSEKTIKEFTEEVQPSAMKIGDLTVATFFPKGEVAERANAPLNSGLFRPYYMPQDEGYIAKDAMSVYACTEKLKERVNKALLEKGVFITDIMSAYISPLAEIEEKAVILPNCQIYGNSVVKSGAVIGPNSVISSSTIGENTKTNNSQVFESTVGANTTVGPFAYIRPMSNVGDNVKIGDFVELKKSTIGEGTKISHFAYIGDSEIGKKVNFSCGAITVNYDGKNKYKTKVGDNCFIGCNVNLVAPVEIGDGAFVAAGSTVTDNVPPEALTVARARQYTKEDWAKQRRQDGKL